MKTENKTTTAEAVELFGRKALFTNERIPLSVVPQGLYRYELRDDGNGHFTSVENNVVVNFAGTIITKSPLELGERGYCELLDEQPDLNFLGYELTIKEFTEDNQ